MNLPNKPPCWGQWGQIQCDPKCDLDCIESRQFWALCEIVTQMASNARRRDYLSLVQRTKGEPLAQRIRAGAVELMRAAA